MSALTFILVVLVAFIAGVASVVDERQFHRPLVACTLMGFALGDPTTGIMLGGALELIALGWMNVGAAMAPDSALASTISAVVVIQGHQDTHHRYCYCCAAGCGRSGSDHFRSYHYGVLPASG